ncbi:MAG: hypothetical protein HOY71_21200 [Nonomuraea sp.]|nr:hypothetical protein [Nonomuraea sp.]
MLRIRDASTGQVAWTAKGSNSLLGISDGWIVAADDWRPASQAEIRLFPS